MDAFESLLEKEYMLLLDFDERVERFDTQPITIPVPGVAKGYTPDVLVHYRPDANSGEILRPLLTEVKHTDDLHRNAEKYAPKFLAAERFARETGWEFQVTTQLDIRTPRLANIKFLREYRNIEPAQEDRNRILELVRLADGAATPGHLLERLAACDEDRLHWLPVIWHALLHRHVITDLDKQLDHNSLLTVPRGRQ
ncbi:MAG: TnsA endonuclease C-terminal domain-containing protein [Burkholderiales bacterium]|nr:TnsA endonuclease C-terminal domain-containing protein [Burkholderiales bacterium]